MGDRETWSTDWRGPPDGDYSPKKPSIGRQEAGPQEFGRHRNGFSGAEEQKGHLPLAKRVADKKDRLSEKKAGGMWKYLPQGCEPDLVKTPKPFNGTNSSWTLGDSQE